MYEFHHRIVKALKDLLIKEEVGNRAENPELSEL